MKNLFIKIARVLVIILSAIVGLNLGLFLGKGLAKLITWLGIQEVLEKFFDLITIG